MIYNQEAIKNLSQEVGQYEIYEQFGHGVMESPHKNGEIIKTLHCSELDAWIISENMNIERWGIMSKRSSWEEPTFRYRKVKK